MKEEEEIGKRVLNKHTGEAYEVIGFDADNSVYVLCKDGDVESRWSIEQYYQHFHTIKVYMTRDGRSIYKIDELPDFEFEDLTEAIKFATGDKDAKE